MLKLALQTRNKQIKLKEELTELLLKDLSVATLRSIDKTLILVKKQISNQDKIISNLLISQN